MNALYRKILFSLVLALGLPLAARADLQQQLNSMFGDMSNYTPPGVFEAQRRGVISGGSFVNRSRIMEENLVGFVPPSYSAGCAGIDLNGGSFSFINGDQFVQLLRSIAANAKGYAFQIALDAMCGTCMSQIETLQKKIQQFNQYFSNSCQLAKGIVTDAKDSFTKGELTTESLTAQFAGVGDIFTTSTNTSGQTPSQQAKQAAPDVVASTIEGNLVWRELNRNAAASWFTANGDYGLLEAIMSVSGTIVIGPLDMTTSQRTTTYSQGNKVTLNDLIQGGTITVYHCNDSYDVNGCLQLVPQPITLTGLRTMLENALLGTDTAPGIVLKFARNTGVITNADRALLSALPEGMGAMIRTLSINGEQLATDFVHNAVPYIAYDMAYTTVSGMLRTVEAATLSTDHPHEKELELKIKEARDAITAESDMIQRKNGPSYRMIEAYNAILKAAEHRAYPVARVRPQMP